MDCPLDYSLCRDTVTLYRQTDNAIERQVLHDCFLQVQEKCLEDAYSPEFERAFLLVVPGGGDVLTGDRVLAGEGPVIAKEDWQNFIPANVQGLCQVQYVQHCCFMGRLCHTEAGRKASTFLY